MVKKIIMAMFGLSLLFTAEITSNINIHKPPNTKAIKYTFYDKICW